MRRSKHCKGCLHVLDGSNWLLAIDLPSAINLGWLVDQSIKDVSNANIAAEVWLVWFVCRSDVLGRHFRSPLPPRTAFPIDGLSVLALDVGRFEELEVRLTSAIRGLSFSFH